mmetsp:Transcript_14678/g.14296  ORF Transcript_14678/g.14296 Transcript_14678/m.14296 type:complete len:107 (-) Transcript_14678:683-1003(-)
MNLVFNKCESLQKLNLEQNFSDHWHELSLQNTQDTNKMGTQNVQPKIDYSLMQNSITTPTFKEFAYRKNTNNFSTYSELINVPYFEEVQVEEVQFLVEPMQTNDVD